MSQEDHFCEFEREEKSVSEAAPSPALVAPRRPTTSCGKITSFFNPPAGTAASLSKNEDFSLSPSTLAAALPLGSGSPPIKFKPPIPPSSKYGWLPRTPYRNPPVPSKSPPNFVTGKSLRNSVRPRCSVRGVNPPTKKNRRSTTRTIAGGTSQTYLDLGQSTFAAAITCPTCGTLYSPGVFEDEAAHAKACTPHLHGISFRSAWARWGEVQRGNGFTVVRVRPGDPAARHAKAREVEAAADADLGFVAAGNGGRGKQRPGGRTLFIYIVAGRAVGLCVSEAIGRAHKQVAPGRRDVGEGRRVRLGIYKLWVHAAHRKTGVATALVDAAREWSVYGTVVPRDAIAFSSPTTNGSAFAKKYTSTEFPLVYDCYSSRTADTI